MTDGDLQSQVFNELTLDWMNGKTDLKGLLQKVYDLGVEDGREGNL